jgi:ubiquinone/menaquinone biosynthesis C-methylase UbiE
MERHHRSFIPAAGHDLLLPLYDPLQKLLGGDRARKALLGQAKIQPGHRVLDIGCGTGSLVVLLKRLHPEAEVVGLDPDPKALARARQKAERKGVTVQLDQGFSDALPYPESSFDRVLSSFMIHHLGPEEKRRTFEEARRVLTPEGSLHVLDFGASADRSEGLVARLLHSSEKLRDHFEGRLVELMRESGFADAHEVAHRRTLVGRIAYYLARAAGS